MDRIQKLELRVKQLEEKETVKPTVVKYSQDKPKLATAITSFGFALIVCVGFYFHIGMGWVIGIGLISLAFVASEG